MIREAYDVTGFGENQNMDPYLKQRQVLAKARGNPAVAPQKRGSLEMLQAELNTPMAIPTQSSVEPPPPTEHVSLTQTEVFSQQQNVAPQNLQKNDLLTLMMKQQTIFQHDADEAFQRHQLETEAAFQRHQKRKDENMQRFQAMMMQNLKD